MLVGLVTLAVEVDSETDGNEGDKQSEKDHKARGSCGSAMENRF